MMSLSQIDSDPIYARSEVPLAAYCLRSPLGVYLYSKLCLSCS